MIFSGAASRGGSERAVLFFWSPSLRYFAAGSIRQNAGNGGAMSRGRLMARTVFVLMAVWSLGTAPARAQDAPVRGGTVVAAIVSDPGHLNPAITTSGATHAASELLYNGLLGRDERGNPLPELAESWQVEQAGAVYRFRLQDGVKWHDGAPFTSADVKFSFEEVLLKYHARTKASTGGVLAGIDTPDERTVVFRFKIPYA